MTIPHKKYGHLLDTYFRYLPCLLDRGHIKAATLCLHSDKQYHICDTAYFNY